VRLAAGDRVLFLSDGIPEAPLANGEPLGYESTARLIAETSGELEPFLAAVRALVQERLADDWTAVVLDVSSS
jgi:serine phosphatase RsbU (regulator of sigma subunit)